MKSIFYLLLLATVFEIISCQSNTSKEKAGSTSDSTLIPPPGTDPDTTDNIPASGYDPATADFKAAFVIKKALKNTILANDISSIPADQRKFKYQAFDLNNDSLPEYFVAMVGTYYCGKDGCTAYLLDNNGGLLNTFPATEFPIYAAFSTTKGWQDLILKSNRKLYILKAKDGKYPSSPAAAAVFKGNPKRRGTEVLDLKAAPYPAFAF